MTSVQQKLTAPVVAIGLAAAVILVMQAWKAAREDYGGDEGFTARRVEAAWPQVYFAFAERVEGYADPFDTRHVYDMNPPLYFALIRTLAGPHPGRVGLRLFSILPAALGLAFLAMLAQAMGRGHSRRVRPGAWAVMAVWALTPVTMFYGHEARPYALPLGMFCATLYGVWRWRDRPLAAGAVMFVSAMLGFLMNFHYPWMLGALAAAMLAQLGMRERWISPRATGAALAGMALGMGAACLALLPQWEIWDFVRRNPTKQINWDVLGHAVAFPLIGPMEALGAWHRSAALGVMAATLILALALLWRARRPAIGVTALCLWLIPFLIPVAGHMMAKAAFFERYTLFSLPGWALTLAWVVEEGLARRGWRQDAALLAVVAVVCNGVLMLNAKFLFPLRQTWTPAVEALLEQSREGEFYFVLPEWQISAFAANAGRPPYAAYLRPGEEVPASAQTIWFLCDDVLPQSIHENFLNRDWEIEPVVPFQGKFLWKLKRADAGS